VDLNFHGTDDQLEDYVFGRLPRPDLPALEEHLMICDACRDRLDSIEAITVGIRGAPGSSQAVLKPASSLADWFSLLGNGCADPHSRSPLGWWRCLPSYRYFRTDHEIRPGRNPSTHGIAR